MPQMKKWILYYLLFNVTLTIGQDLRFSQYYLNPILQNPANTGNFLGDYRINSIYRSQWGNINSLYSTPSIAFDTKVPLDPELNNVLGLGTVIVNDNAGGGLLSNLHFRIIGASKRSFRVGASYDTRIFSSGGMVNASAYEVGATFVGIFGARQIQRTLPCPEF